MANRLIVPVVFLAIIFVVAAFLVNDQKSSSQTEDPKVLAPFAVVGTVPDSTVTKTDGSAVQLSKAFIRPTLLSFWSSSCGECEIGLPALDQFSRDQQSIDIFLVNVRDEPEDAEELLSRLSIKRETFYDRQAEAFNIWQATMPASYFIRNGQVEYLFPGRISSEHLQALLTIL